MIREDLEKVLRENFDSNYQFLIHRFDAVEIGEEKEILLENCEDILEVHIFNGSKELFGRRVEDRLVFYDPLIYDKDEDKDDEENKSWHIRTYALEEKFNDRTKHKVNSSRRNYNFIKVAEHISFDENCLAYIDKTLILSLGKGSDSHE